MATETEIIKKLVDKLDSAVAGFNKSIPGIQQQIADAIEGLIRDLDLKGDTIINNVANLRKIGALKIKINTIIKKSGYTDAVSDFMMAFNEVSDIQDDYFRQVTKEFKGNAKLDAVKRLAIENTIESLTESGLNAALVAPVRNMLVKNATTGVTWQQLNRQVRTFVTGTKEGAGVLERYSKVTSTDALNQFAAQYMGVVADDLGLEWYRYVGIIMDTSRAWCIACKKREYLHQSEFQQLIDGDFPEFDDAGGEINPKTGLPSGMIDGTNANNLIAYRGGWGCNHQMIPVAESSVPTIRRMGLAEGYSVHYKNEGNGGTLHIHKGANKKELKANIESAIPVIDKYGTSFKIPKYDAGAKGKQPDYLAEENNVQHLADLKTPESMSWRAISEGIRRTDEQGAVHTITKLSSTHEMADVVNGVRHGFKNAPNMEKVDLVLPNKDVIRITRQDFDTGDYAKLIEDGLK